jgi:hypothetical protein
MDEPNEESILGSSDSERDGSNGSVSEDGPENFPIKVIFIRTAESGSFVC